MQLHLTDRCVVDEKSTKHIVGALHVKNYHSCFAVYPTFYIWFYSLINEGGLGRIDALTQP